MKIKREDTNAIEVMMKNAMSPNRIMKEFVNHEFDDDPVMVDLCTKCMREFPEMFPALGIMYTIITGNLMHYIANGSKYMAVSVPRPFMTHIIMDTYYGEMLMWQRWHDDRDYRIEANWSQTFYVARCDKRIIDPSRQYGFHISCLYGRGSDIIGIMLRMHGGNEMMRSAILSDLYTLADAFYADELMKQDIKKLFNDNLTQWLRWGSTIRTTPLETVIPEMKQYINRAAASVTEG